MNCKVLLGIFLLGLLILPSGVFALQYKTDRMNFQEFTFYNHTQNITNDAYYPVTVNVTIPQGFAYVGATGTPSLGADWILWTLPGGSSVTYTLQSPNQSSSFYGQTYRSDIYVDGTLLDALYFVMVKDEDIVDFKIEKGHGDSNYFYGNKDGGYPYIGNESTTLFNILRIWNINHKFNSTEKALNGELTCTFPNENILTKGRVSSLACSGQNCTVKFYFDEITSYWWRSGVFSQQFFRDVGEKYTVSCGGLTYHYEHGDIITRPVGFSLESRNVDPFNVSLTVTNDEYRFKIKNVEKYPIHDIQFDFDVNAEKEVQNLVDLQPGEEVEYIVYLDGTGTLRFTADYIPSWEKTSLKPFHHKSVRSYAFSINANPANIVDIEERVIDIQSAAIPFVINLDSYINRHPEPNMTSVVGFETGQQMVDPQSYLFDIYDLNERLFATSNETRVNETWQNYSSYLSNHSCWVANCTNSSTSQNEPEAPYLLRNVVPAKKQVGLYLFTTDLSENFTIFVNYTKYERQYYLTNTTINVTDPLTNITTQVNATVNESTVVNYTVTEQTSVFQNVTSGIYRSEVGATYSTYSKVVSKQFRITRGIFDVSIFARNSPVAGTPLLFTYVAKNKGEFSQDVFVKYWTVINGQTIGLTEETVLAPAVTEEMYERAITIPAGTPIGTYRVYVNLTYDTTIPTATASAEYQVITLSTEAITSSTGSGSGTTSLSDTDLRKISIVQYPAKINVEQGDFVDILFEIKNTGERTLSDIKASFTGIESGWYSVVSSLESLSPDESGKFIIRLSIPDYAEVKEYPLELIVSGNGVFDSRNIILNVQEGIQKDVALEDVAVTELLRDQRGDIFVTLRNRGSTDANISVVVRPPNNWITDTFEYEDLLLTGEEKTYRYKVVPDAEGVHSIAIVYTVQQRQFTKEVFVKVGDSFFFEPFVPSLSTNQLVGGFAILALLGGAGYAFYRIAKQRRWISPVIALPSQRGKIIGLVSSKDGVGKTVLTANLAAALAQRDAKVLAVDGNLTNGNLSLMLGLRNVVVTLHDVITGKIKIEQTIYQHESGIHVIPTPVSLDHERHINLGKIIGKLRKQYDYILIDVPASQEDEAESVLSACDEAIFVSEPSLLEATHVTRTLDMLKRLEVPVIGIVLDRVSPTTSIEELQGFEKLTQLPILGTIPDDQNIGVAVVNQRLLVLDVPESAASEEIYKVAETIDGAFATTTQEEQLKEELIDGRIS